MPVPFRNYINTKDNICLCYYGLALDYLVQINLLKECIEKEFVGLKVYISCRDDFSYLISDISYFVPMHQIEIEKSNFAYIKEIQTSLQCPHPIEQLILQSNLPVKLDISKKPLIPKSIICPDSHMPEWSYKNIDKLKMYAQSQGYQTCVVGSDVHSNVSTVDRIFHKEEKIHSLDDVGWVIGVENEYLYLAAAKGIRTTLINSSIGANLYRKMFPFAEIINI